MKKYFPILFSAILFITVFFSAISLQMILDYFNNQSSDKGPLNTDQPTSSDASATVQLSYFDSLFNYLHFKNIEGNEFSLSRVNAPIVILNFWTSWCPACIGEISSLVELKKRYAKDLEIVAINGDQSLNSDNGSGEMSSILEKIKKLKKIYNINFQVVIDSAIDATDMTSNRYIKKDMFSLFKVKSVPLTIVFFKGKAYFSYAGEINFVSNSFLSLIDELIMKI